MSIVAFVLVFTTLVLVTLAVAEFALRILDVPFEIARKSFHLLAGTVCIVMTVQADSATPLVVTGLLFAGTLPVSIVLNLFKIQTRERGYGTVAFALGFAAVSYLDFERPVVLVAALVVLTYGDGLAAMVGTTIGRHEFGLGRTRKTFEGTVTFTFISWIGVATTLVVYREVDPFTALAMALLLAIVAGAVEAISTSDFDNLVLPLYSAILLDVMLRPRGFPAVAVGYALCFLIVGGALWRHWVNLPGAIVASLIIVTLFGIGEFIWLAPVVYLLVSSSLVSSVVRKRYTNPFSASEGARGLGQIAAKGIPSMVCGLVFAVTGDQIWFFVMLTVVATASSDTFASAIGALDEAETVPSLPSFVAVPKGMSGGISLYGTIAAFIATIPVAAFVLAGGGKVAEFLVVIVMGFVGANLDSVLGTTMQALYRCPACGRRTEATRHCMRPTVLIKGHAWMTNEMVNAVSGVAAGALAWGLLATARLLNS
ncbi:MAG: DUF92 domain-containing protein [Myxococcota bacterium]